MSDHGLAGDRERKSQAIVDKQEIYEALVRYCCGIDRGDLDLVLSAFHEDATDNHSGVEERAVERFRRTVVEAKSMRTSHHLGNVYIQLSGTVAHAQSYLTAWHRFDYEGRTYDWVINARYLDRFECRVGEWRIAHRTVVYDCERFEEVQPGPAGHPSSSFFAHVTRGTRSKSDPMYKFLRF